tara:strand:+ start:1269 stop:1979 length:711 start_codon:yes stop_codon:yes gene_type:complete
MRILEANEIGKGVLLENDAGHISPNYYLNKKIITETKGFKDSGDEVFIYAVLQKCGVQNRNGRIYPAEILKREVDKYQQLIGQGRALSELNHPESSLVDLERSSHRVVETFWDGDTLMGKLQILTSPAYHKTGIISCVGDIAANLLRHGVTLGISSRGVGSLKSEGGKNIVQDDFELICFDLVSSPSTPGAYLFKDMKDKDKYAETLEETIPLADSAAPKSDALSMMKKLDNFLDR